VKVKVQGQGGSRTEDRGQKSDVRRQTSEVRCQRSEVRGGKANIGQCSPPSGFAARRVAVPWMSILAVLCARYRPLQFGGFVPGLEAAIQLRLDSEDLVLLRELISMRDINGHATAGLGLRHHGVEILPTLL
jgi:hypothetical protein